MKDKSVQLKTKEVPTKVLCLRKDEVIKVMTPDVMVLYPKLYEKLAKFLEEV